MSEWELRWLTHVNVIVTIPYASHNDHRLASRLIFHLARYVLENISSDVMKQTRFCMGFSPRLCHDFNLLDFINCQGLVNKSFGAEHGNVVFEVSHKRDCEIAPSSSSGPQRRRIWFSNRDFPRIKTLFQGHQHVPPRKIHNVKCV